MPAVSETIEAPQPRGKDAIGTEQDEWLKEAPSSLEVRERVEAQFKVLLELVHRSAGSERYEGFERELIVEVWRLARLLINLFLCLSQERLQEQGDWLQPGEKGKKPRSRLLGTYFGKVRYWRSYAHRPRDASGRYPLDERLELLADGFSLGLLGRGVELATKMSYASAEEMLKSFVGWSPSADTLEKATLGLGRYTGGWFEQLSAPADDGEVLLIQVDSKATPTATEAELQKRRKARRNKSPAPSPRHRGRDKRAESGPKQRRKKGDKAKNGRMATLVVMYTLRKGRGPDGKPLLLGPINRRLYASYAPKRHAVAVARREADKRGFGRNSNKTIQIVTDGDEELERCISNLFPHARHTLDIVHATEYLWKAGACLYPEGSEKLQHWVQTQKQRLLRSEAAEVVIDADEACRRLKSSSKRLRLTKLLDYLAKRVDMMNYSELRAEDLEIASGIVEGAVRYVISQRFDEGGMRWIRQRAEALLQLRCIELNGHWQDFLSFAHARLLTQSLASKRPPRLLRSKPQPLPKYGLKSRN